MHENVYAVGHAVVSARGRLVAALLVGGESAVASHPSAADLHGLTHAPHRTLHHVTLPTHRRAPGIAFHRSRLDPRDVALVDDLPCTTLARTLLGLADTKPRRWLERACERSEMLRVFDVRELEDVLGRARGRRGAPVLRQVLDDQRRYATRTDSELCDRLLEIVRRAGLPMPKVDEPLVLGAGATIRPDLYWPQFRLIAEADGRWAHGTARAFEGDRARDIAVQAAGIRVARFTWKRVERDEKGIVRDLARLMG